MTGPGNVVTGANLKIDLKKNLPMSEEKAERVRSLIAWFRQSISKAHSERKKPLFP